MLILLGVCCCFKRKTADEVRISECSSDVCSSDLALDGSGARDDESLLTAILDPDAAVEGGYALYRVTKKDNGVVEGYLYNKDKKGVTISSIDRKSVV